VVFGIWYLVVRCPVGLFEYNRINGNLPVHCLCGSAVPSLESIRFVLLQEPTLLHTPNCISGHLPVHSLCESISPSIEAIRFMLQLGPALLRTPNRILGHLPLHYVCLACHAAAQSLPVIRFLRDHDPGLFEIQNNVNGMLPLHCLCVNNPPVAVVQYALDSFNGAVIVRTLTGDLPVVVAIKNRCSEDIITVLMKAHPGALNLETPRNT